MILNIDFIGCICRLLWNVSWFGIKSCYLDVCWVWVAFDLQRLLLGIFTCFELILLYYNWVLAFNICELWLCFVLCLLEWEILLLSFVIIMCLFVGYLYCLIGYLLDSSVCVSYVQISAFQWYWSLNSVNINSYTSFVILVWCVY